MTAVGDFEHLSSEKKQVVGEYGSCKGNYEIVGLLLQKEKQLPEYELHEGKLQRLK